MKHKYVIVVPGIKESIDLGFRLIGSSKTISPNIEMYFGVSPKDQPREIFKKEGITDYSLFETNKFSFVERAMSCFLSHYMLWKICADTDNSVFMIFEHDALLIEDSYDEIFLMERIDKSKGLISFGKPSYGKFRTMKNGIYPLYSKKHLPGAHAYLLHSDGAKKLVYEAKKNGIEPTDVFLSKNRFPWIEETSPWMAYVDETFSTVQKEKGCIAKHQYNKTPYQLLGEGANY